jgi:hypothetical protein
MRHTPLLLALLVTAPAGAQNLLANGGFEDDLTGWTQFASSLSPTWSPLDAAGSPTSGSLRVVDSSPIDNNALPAASQCVAIEAGERYAARGSFLFPAGQARSGEGGIFVFFMAEADCGGNPLDSAATRLDLDAGTWTTIAAPAATAPVGTVAALVYFGFHKVGNGGQATFHLDDAQLTSAAPDPPAGPWISVPDLPDFRFKVRITPQGQPAFLGSEVDDCVPETVCIAGALPTRTETFLRVIGPRPNGYLWPQIVKFTVSRVEVWVEQLASGQVNYYDLPALPADTAELPGLVDKAGFLP